MEIVISTSGLLSIAGFIVAQTISFVVFCITIWKDLYVLKSEIILNQSQDTKEIAELNNKISETKNDLSRLDRTLRADTKEDIKRLYDKLENIKS